MILSTQYLGSVVPFTMFFVWLTLKLSGFILRKKKRLKTVQFGASTIFNLFQSLKTHFNLSNSETDFNKTSRMHFKTNFNKTNTMHFVLQLYELI